LPIGLKALGAKDIVKGKSIRDFGVSNSPYTGLGRRKSGVIRFKAIDFRQAHRFY
jgi:hypothetical protein